MRLRWLPILLLVVPAHATYKPEYDKSPQAVRDWFQAQKLTPAAAVRLGIATCCEKAERLRTKFLATKDDDWAYYTDPNCVKDGCPVMPIPNDTIHKEPIKALKPEDDNLPEFEQMRAEGVLMIWNDKITCFWPPESGI